MESKANCCCVSMTHKAERSSFCKKSSCEFVFTYVLTGFAPDTLVILYISLYYFTNFLRSPQVSLYMSSPSNAGQILQFPTCGTFAWWNQSLKELCWSPGSERNSTGIMSRDWREAKDKEVGWTPLPFTDSSLKAAFHDFFCRFLNYHCAFRLGACICLCPRVFLNASELHRMHLHQYRSKVGVVSQDVLLLYWPRVAVPQDHEAKLFLNWCLWGFGCVQTPESQPKHRSL